MKKYTIWASALALSVFSACDPMKDVYAELDAVEKPNKKQTEYTLTADDYNSISRAEEALANGDADKVAAAKAIALNGAANNVNEIIRQTPAILKRNYPALQTGSAVQLYYNLNHGAPAYLKALVGASAYELTELDYATAEVLGYFSPSNPASKGMNGILTQQFPGAVKGDQVLVSYLYSHEDPSGIVVDELFNEGFSGGTLGQFTPFSAVGDQVWNYRYYAAGDAHYAQMSGFASAVNHENVDYLVSPQIDLAGYIKPALTISQAARFFAVAGTTTIDWSLLKLLVSDNFDGVNAETANWTELNFTPSTGTDYVYVTTEGISLSAFSGKKIHIACRYTSHVTNSPTWQINGISISAQRGATALKSAASDKFVAREYFGFDGAVWAVKHIAYALSNADYSSMGKPGAGNYFSASIRAEDYLPRFLTAQYPYAQQGDAEALSYNYFVKQNEIDTRVVEYSYRNGTWNSVSYLEVFNDQFVCYEGTWVFDPTVKFTMEKSDYSFVVNEVKAQHGAVSILAGGDNPFLDRFNTSEFYYGASEYYGNFDLRLSTRNETYDTDFAGLGVDEKIALTWKRVEEAVILMLEKKYPDATVTSSGVDLLFWISFNTYENDLSKKVYTGIFQVAAQGTNVEFARQKEVEDQMVKDGKLAADAVKWN